MGERRSECSICGAEVIDQAAEHQLLSGDVTVDVMRRPCANGHTPAERDAHDAD